MISLLKTITNLYFFCFSKNFTERGCDKPSPQNGGLYCVGDRKRYESCDTWDCPRGANEYRLEQCQQVPINLANTKSTPC